MIKGCYSVIKISPFSLFGLIKVEAILHECGKNMAEKEGLNHWNNSHIKEMAIVVICALKNKIYLVMEGNKPVATFQVKTVGDKLWFMKLATKPGYSSKGIGSFCLGEIEQKAIASNCGSLCCEVYEKSKRAITFYEHRGYEIKGKKKTLKYVEVMMEKVLEK